MHYNLAFTYNNCISLVPGTCNESINVYNLKPRTLVSSLEEGLGYETNQCYAPLTGTLNE